MKFAGLGTIVNVLAIIIGGLFGYFLKDRLSDSLKDTLQKTMGVSTILLGIAGVLEKMLIITDGAVHAEGSLKMILCLTFGAIVGELIDLEKQFDRFGEWLKQHSGNSQDNSFLNAFITASLTVSIGAMAIIGSINDVLYQDPTILFAKALLDFSIILVFAASLGKGSIYSAIPVGILQGSMTLLAALIAPLMSAAALDNIALVGSALIFCVGINLLIGKTVKVANLLPSLLFAFFAALLF
ncbi:MAG: DUF554 domain-containing protein [Erysipelotrichaceae bacterium]|nr:DUF554 domain-containing protein [Erysipelotrichaceae bacterium]